MLITLPYPHCKGNFCLEFVISISQHKTSTYQTLRNCFHFSSQWFSFWNSLFFLFCLEISIHISKASPSAVSFLSLHQPTFDICYRCKLSPNSEKMCGQMNGVCEFLRKGKLKYCWIGLQIFLLRYV